MGKDSHYIALVLKRARILKGLAQQEVADKLHLHQTYIAHIEKGSWETYKLGIATVQELVQKLLGVGVEWMKEEELFETLKRDEEFMERFFKIAKEMTNVRKLTMKQKNMVLKHLREYACTRIEAIGFCMEKPFRDSLRDRFGAEKEYIDNQTWCRILKALPDSVVIKLTYPGDWTHLEAGHPNVWRSTINLRDKYDYGRARMLTGLVIEPLELESPRIKATKMHETILKYLEKVVQNEDLKTLRLIQDMLEIVLRKKI